MAAESSPNHGRIVLVVLLALMPLGLGAGWLIGRIQGALPPPPKAAVVVALPAPPPVHEAARPTGSVVVTAAPGQPPEPARQPAEVSSDWTSYESAIQQSNTNGKPILIDFNAQWCGPCQRLRQDVFDDGVRGHAVQAAVIPVSIVDRAREEGRNPPEIETLQARYGVNAFPTLVVFSPATGRTESTKGYGDPDQMVQWIRWAADRVK